MMTPQGAFSFFKIRVAQLRRMKDYLTPQRVLEYEAMLQALCALAEASGSRDVEEQIKDPEVWVWMKELEETYAAQAKR